MALEFGNAQWIGRRAKQQDTFAFIGLEEPDLCRHAGVLAIVADGMGGLLRGSEASRLAVQAMRSAYLSKRPDESIPDALTRSLKMANSAVYELAQHSGGEGSVGTTLVAATVYNSALYWVAAGDSRLYLYRAANDSLTQCTEDHNYGNALLHQVQTGTLRREAIIGDPDWQALTSFLGMAEIPFVDRNVRPLALAPGDRLILCSDGVYGALDENELKACLNPDAQATSDALMEAVKHKGIAGQDNATVAVLGCAEPTDPTPGITPPAA